MRVTAAVFDRSGLARLNADGSLDANFSATGLATQPILQITLDPSGRILLTDGSVPARRLANGAADSTWREGYYRFLFGSGAGKPPRWCDPPPRSTAQRPRRRRRHQLAGHFARDVPARATSVRIDFNDDGVVNSAFANTESNGPSYGNTVLDFRALADGTVVLRDAPAGTNATAGAIAADGSSWIAGPFSSVGPESRLHFARFTSGGQLSPVKLTTGFVAADGSPAPPAALLALRSGNVLALGNFLRVDGFARAHVARLFRE